jgi:large subunit ribosomal protein L35
MPKMKTHSGAKKRFKKTGSGKLKSYQAHTSHRMRNKSKKAKRKLMKAVIVHSSEERRMKRLLGIY